MSQIDLEPKPGLSIFFNTIQESPVTVYTPDLEVVSCEFEEIGYVKPKSVASGNSVQVGTIDLYDFNSENFFIKLRMNSVESLLADKIAVILNDTEYQVTMDSSVIGFSSQCQFNEIKEIMNSSATIKGSSVCQTLSLTPPGQDYIGNISVTRSGRTCQQWDKQTPIEHKYPFYEHNYCRNPSDNSGGLWCFLADGNTDNDRWEYCSQIPGNTFSL